jgi:LysM repeat protein
MDNISKNISMDAICPYLGLIDDPKTSTVFADSCNACQRADPPKPIVLTHQRNFCLTDKHTECEGFVNGWKKGFPRSLHNKACRRRRGYFRSIYRKPSVVWSIAIGLLILLVIFGVYFAITTLQPAQVATPTSDLANDLMATETARAAGAMHTPTPALTITSTPVPEPSESPTPHLMQTQTPGPALLTPFGGPELQLMVYQVDEGESFELIANQFNTTAEILMALNVRAALSIWIGDMIVVCVDCIEMPDLPPLAPLYLEQGISLSDLAAEYDTPIEDLRAWNGLGPDDWIEGERWVVVPQDQSSET